MELDTSTEFGARVARRLADEQIIWLTTVRADGTPQPSPVWFLWDGASFLIFSQPKAQKLKNIAHGPTVSLHLDGDGRGGDIVVFTGRAAVEAAAPSVVEVPAYVEKYRAGIANIGMTPAQMAAEFSTAVRVTPTHLRGH